MTQKELINDILKGEVLAITKLPKNELKKEGVNVSVKPSEIKEIYLIQYRDERT